MVTTLKSGATKKSMITLLNDLARELKPQGVDVRRFVGKIRLKKDALNIQKDIRDEWE